MKPAIPLTDPRFQYTRALDTDLRRSFAKVRAEQQQQSALLKAGIVPIKRAAK